MKSDSAQKADKLSITFDSESALFEEIKIVFQTINDAIPEDSPHLSFKNRFIEVYNFFVKTYENNQKLLQKAQETNALIIMNANKATTIIQIVNEDAKKLVKYKQDYDEVLEILKSLKTSEGKSRELLEKLTSTVAGLKGQVQRGEAFNFGEEDTIGSIINDVNNLKREKAKAAEEIDTARSEIRTKKDVLKNTNNQIAIMKKNSAELESSIEDYQNQLDKLNSEVETTYDGINSVRPVVDGQKKLILTNLQSLKEHEGIKRSLEKQNNEHGKLLSDAAFKLKQTRYLIGSNSKRRNKLISQNALNTTAIDHLSKQYSNAISEFDQKSNDLKTINSEFDSNAEILKTVSKELDKIDEIKMTTRGVMRDLRINRNELNHSEAKNESERARTVRKIHSTQQNIGVIERHIEKEKVETANAHLIYTDLKSEKKGQKRKMQSEKIKLRQYEQEIEMKIVERNKVDVQCQLIEEDREINLNKIEEDSMILEELQDKLHQQDELMDVLRKERNTFKRKLIAVEKENVALQKEYNDAETEYNELIEKNDLVSLKVADEHFNARGIKQELILMAADVSELHQKIYDANHSISALEAERQLLNHIVNDASSDRYLILKEIDTASASKKVINGTLVERRQAIDNLNSDIITLLQHINRGQREYNTLCDKLADLTNEMKAAVQKNYELERKVDRLNYMKNDEKRLFNLLSQENDKCSLLIREISHPRNVHRWNMYDAIDPVYKRNLMYMAQIYSKIDVAHRYLIHLEHQRDELKKKVQEKNKKVIPNGGSELAAFQYHLNKYKKDIAEKDKMINEMMIEIKDNRSKLNNIKSGVLDVRSKCNTRRVSVSQLRNRVIASRNEKRQQNMFFITESEATTQVLGGGFVQRISTNISNDDSQIHKEKIMFDENKLALDSSPRKYRNAPTTPKNQTKRIMRPKTAIKRPLTSVQTKF